MTNKCIISKVQAHSPLADGGHSTYMRSEDSAEVGWVVPQILCETDNIPSLWAHRMKGPAVDVLRVESLCCRGLRGLDDIIPISSHSRLEMVDEGYRAACCVRWGTTQNPQSRGTYFSCTLRKFRTTDSTRPTATDRDRAPYRRTTAIII